MSVATVGAFFVAINRLTPSSSSSCEIDWSVASSSPSLASTRTIVRAFGASTWFVKAVSFVIALTWFVRTVSVAIDWSNAVFAIDWSNAVVAGAIECSVAGAIECSVASVVAVKVGG
jgi:hypothetical protein